MTRFMGLRTGGMGAGHHAEAKELGEPHGIHLVVLELGVADDAQLEWMGHDPFLDAGNGDQDVMEDVLVHGRKETA
jgi:hypothetical protein